MSDDGLLARITAASFTPLGWFAPTDIEGAEFLVLIGNAGPEMFARFERDGGVTLDHWTKAVVDPLAAELGARAVYPFDKPYPPFQRWARAAGQGFASPLGLNIHPVYGLWHAYRAALLFPRALVLSPLPAAQHPCDSCSEKPCLAACPVSAFDGRNYDVKACASHLHSANRCMAQGCMARLACPVGQDFRYAPAQMQFHMKAFKAAHEL